jgi:hypothetical protein
MVTILKNLKGLEVQKFERVLRLKYLNSEITLRRKAVITYLTRNFKEPGF